MNPLSLSEDRRPLLASICREHGVRRLEIFGSALDADFDDARSDVDLLVQFDSSACTPALQMYFGLREQLERLFGRSVDLVVDGAITNPYLRRAIERQRRLLYAA